MDYRAKQEHKTFSFFAKNYVERNINEWQKKGEFEKSDDWKKRVNKNTLNQRVFALTKEAQDIYIKDFMRVMPADKTYIVGDYDPDHETYRIHSDYSKSDILVQVPSNDALEFKTTFASLNKERSSEIYSLYEIRREDGTRINATASYDKQYLEGRYGADPYLRRMLDWEV